MNQERSEYLKIAAFIVVFFLSIFSRSLTAISVIILCLSAVILRRGRKELLLPLVIFSVSSGFIALLINLYFHPDGVSLFTLVHNAALASLRIFSLAEISIAYAATVSGEISYDFFSKFLPRSAILTAIAILLLPRLAYSLGEARISLVQRGIIPPGKPRLGDLRNFGLLFKTLIVEAVEESWSITEALIERGYSVRRRT